MTPAELADQLEHRIAVYRGASFIIPPQEVVEIAAALRQADTDRVELAALRERLATADALADEFPVGDFLSTRNHALNQWLRRLIFFRNSRLAAQTPPAAEPSPGVLETPFKGQYATPPAAECSCARCDGGERDPDPFCKIHGTPPVADGGD